jgi:hypothetical protein
MVIQMMELTCAEGYNWTDFQVRSRTKLSLLRLTWKMKVENMKLKAELKAELKENHKLIKELSTALKQYIYLVNDNTKIGNAIEMLLKNRNPKMWSMTQADQLAFAIRR